MKEYSTLVKKTRKYDGKSSDGDDYSYHSQKKLFSLSSYSNSSRIQRKKYILLSVVVVVVVDDDVDSAALPNYRNIYIQESESD